MTKNDNPHALRFLESMEKHGEKETAENFSVEHPLSKSADFNKKYAWAKDIWEFLDTNYDEELVKEIRMDCACGPEMGKGNKIKGIYEKETDPYVFVEKTNKLNLGFSLDYDGDAYYLIYLQRYCSCVKRNQVSIEYYGTFQRDIINDNELPCEHICLKIIDLDLSINESVVSRNLKEIQGFGFKIVADNYNGANLNLLKLVDLPINGIKMSAELVRKAGEKSSNRIVLEGIVKTLKKLEYTICFGDIENEKEDKLIKTMKIDYVQGPFYSKKMTEREFNEFYRNQLISILSTINQR